MWIAASNLYSRLARSTPAERRWLARYLTFNETQLRRGAAPRTSQTCLLNAVTHTFPSGLLGYIARQAPKDKMEVKIADRRQRPGEPDPNADLGWLRDYQLAAIEKCKERTRGILWMPTGSGKGEVIVGLTRAIPCNWLFVVHRAGLVNDIADRYENRNMQKAGRIGDGLWDLELTGSSSLTCATFQSLHKARGTKQFAQLVGQIDGVCFDEAHTLPAQSFWRVAMALKNAYWRIGMSGTPLSRGDRRSIYTIAATGPVIYRIRPEKLIARGVLARPKIYMVPCYQDSHKPTWQGVYGELVVRSTKRNRLLAAAVNRAAKPCLVFVKEIKHGRQLRDRLLAAGESADFVWGSDSQQSRDRAIQRLVRGEIDTLICSVVFQEGTDIPSLESVVIGSGGKSTIAALQRIGRGMRSDRGRKKTFEVWDILDSGNKWMEKHAKARRRAYEKDGHTVHERRLPLTKEERIAESEKRLDGEAP